jgi:hypothetical protein
MQGTLPDLERWERKVKDPLWYFQLEPEFRRLMSSLRGNLQEFGRVKEMTYGFYETHLLNRTIALGESGEDWDRERKPIDTIVLHHTHNPPGMRRSRLSAIELIRLYARQYALKEVPQPIYSAHFHDGVQVFWPYHWFVRKDGTFERLLDDHEIGWHAGNWDVNCRSVAICFDGDFEESRPSDIELVAAALIIRRYYPQVLKQRIVGHCEVKPQTTCPSKLFLSTNGRKGWKDDLLALV